MSKEQSTVVSEFLTFLTVEKQYAPTTISAYGRDLKSFFDFQRGKDPKSIDADDIKRFVAELNQDGLAASSIGRLLSCLRSFFNFAIREGHCTTNPAALVQNPKGKSRLPRTLDVDQMNALLTAKAETPIEKRDLAIWELLYSAGLRLAELVNIDIADLDLKEGLVCVTGKGNKSRFVPVGSKATTAITNWLSSRGVYDTSDPLFTSMQGRRLTPRAVQYRLKSYGAKQMGTDGLYPHMFRHSFATHMLESSGDLRAVQELLGHENISTTQVYTHLDMSYMTKVYNASHPRANRKK